MGNREVKKRKKDDQAKRDMFGRERQDEEKDEKMHKGGTESRLGKARKQKEREASRLSWEMSRE